MGEKVGKKLGEKMGEKTGEKVGESLGEIHKLNLYPSCLEESKFLAPAPYASPSPFPFLDSSRILTTSLGSP